MDISELGVTGCMHLAIIYESLQILRALPKARNFATVWMFEHAIRCDFLAGMCQLRKWNPSLIYNVKLDTILSCRWPRAIWLLARWIKQSGEQIPSDMFTHSKEDANKLLIDGAKTNCSWKIRLAKKMGADATKEAMLSCFGITPTVQLASFCELFQSIGRKELPKACKKKKLWKLSEYCFSFSMPPY